METKRTNKKVLIEGLKKMGISLACMLLGPSFIHIAFTNTEKPLYIPILIIGLIICGLAIFFAFKGLMTITDSMFKD
ncbi:DUF6095 family protein [Formosa haliotis]|uniref:DUF6095 family protein n=1 Tax=Formosa haliotis TaxID=1555194 RepID=UPI0008246D8E|nr:DUF6095 family protein [Formosa haliotis]